MRNFGKLAVAVVFSTAGLSAIPNAAHAADYPSQPIRVMLGYTPGGAADAVARAVMPKLGELLGQTMIIEYKAGAGGSIAADAMLRAEPDGYTLHLIDSGTMAILPNIRKVSYNPLKSFTPIGMAAQGGLVVATHPSVPANSLEDLLKLLRQDPNGYNYATSGVGGGGHVAMELLKMDAKVSMQHVAYRGGGPAMVDLIGGQIPVAMSTLAPALPQIRAGKIKALGVTSGDRATALPGVPTVAEQGYPGFEALNWYALIGPAKLPESVANKINEKLNLALGDPAVQAMLAEQGLETSPGKPANVLTRTERDLAKWKTATSNANITLE